MAPEKSKGWCFTLHDYVDDDVAIMKKWQFVSYLVMGFEICPETQRPHIQGYVEWTSKRAFSTIAKLNKRIHWEIAMGTGAENRAYCTKDGNFYEFGQHKLQGQRTDLEEIRSLIDQGRSELEIAEEHFPTWARNYKAFERYANLKSKDRTGQPKIIWLWGGTGTGKTRRATEDCDSYYIKDGTKWWDRYAGESRIVIDDFDGAWPFRDFLRLTDRYKYQGQVKGGYVKISASEIYITCEYPPSHFWMGTELAQVERRIRESGGSICFLSHTDQKSGGNTGPQTEQELENNFLK